MLKKEDRRIISSKSNIKKSFLELLSNNSISKITVTKLCKHANINRTTFYKYYLDIYDLLEKIENELYMQFQESINNTLINKSIDEFTIEMFNLIYNNKEICKILIYNNADTEFIRKVFYLAHDKFISEWTSNIKVEDNTEFEFLFSYMANGSIGVIQDWVQNDFIQKPQYVANFICDINNKVLYNNKKH